MTKVPLYVAVRGAVSHLTVSHKYVYFYVYFYVYVYMLHGHLLSLAVHF